MTTPVSDGNAGVVELPRDLEVCELGAELISVSKERNPSGWLLWGNYGCCGMILLDCLREEPLAVVLDGRHFDFTPSAAAEDGGA